MNKSFLTVTALFLAGSLCASATWKESTKMQSTDKVKYTYEEESSTNFFGTETSFTGIDTTGVSNEVQHHVAGTVDFRRDDRYHITFEVKHQGYNSGETPASVVLSLISTGDDVSLLFGNAADTMARFGCILNKDVTATFAQENFVNNSAGTNYWSTLPSGMAYGNGTYQYDLIFETFSDNSISDRVYFGVTKEDTGQTVTSLIVNSSHFGAGGDTTKVFDDIGFHLVGNSGGALNNTGGNPGATLVGNSTYVPQSKMTVYTRTEEIIPEPPAPEVPEPSAFGLLAGLGAIALAVSRRRRSR